MAGETKKVSILVTLKNQAEKEFKKLDKSVGGLSKAVGQGSVAFAGLAAAGAAGVGAIGAIALKTGATFESSMSTVKAITNATGEDFDNLRDLARRLGKETAFSASEAAQGIKFLGMAGFETNEIMEALPATLDLAAASGIDLGRAADITSNILSQFGADASETTRFVDVLAKTVNTSNTDMEQLSEAMKYMGPTASALGVSLEETAATVGILGDNGLQGSIATRALGTSMIRLAKPTKQMLGVMEDLNLDFYDAQGNFIGIAGTIEELEKGFVGLTTEQKQAALSTIFGGEAIQELNILMKTGADGIRAYTGELEDSEGTARRMAEEMLNNLIGQFKVFGSTLEGVGIDIAYNTGLLGGLTGALKFVNGWVNENSETIISYVNNAIKYLGDEWNELNERFGITEKMNSLITWFKDNKQVVKDFLLAFAVGGAIAATLGLLALLANPLTLVITIITALAAAFAYLKNNADVQAFVKKFTENFDALKLKLEEFINSPAVQQILAYFQDLGGRIVNNLVTGFEQIQQAFIDNKEEITQLAQVLSVIFGGVVVVVLAILGELFNYFAWLIPQAIAQLIGVIGFLVNAFHFLVAVNNTIKAVMIAVFNFIVDFIRGKIDSIKSQFQGVLTAATDVFNSIKDSMTTAINSAKDAVSNAVDSIIDKIKSIPKPDLSGLGEGIKNFGNRLGIGGSAIGGVVKNTGVRIVHKGEAIIPARTNPGNPAASNPIGGATINLGGITINSSGGDGREMGDQLFEQFKKRLAQENLNSSLGINGAF